MGHEFVSATDSEVIAHLISHCLEGDSRSRTHRTTAVRSTSTTCCCRRSSRRSASLQGTYGLVVLFRDHPDVMIAARLGSPLVVGIGQNEHYVASDASPLAGYADKIVYLADHQVALITANGVRVTHREQGHVQPHIEPLGDRRQQGRAGRLPALHAQGDLRAARGVGKRHARSLERRRRHGGVRRLESLDAGTAARQPHPVDGLRHQLALVAGGRVHDRRTVAIAGGSGVCQRAALSQSARRSRHAVVRDHPERRDGRHVGRACAR